MKASISLLKILLMVFLFYVFFAWTVFQWRNPLSNEMSLYRNFIEVVSWEKMQEYQPRVEQ